MRKTILLAALAAFSLAAPAQAHNQWLLPSITVLSDTAQSVTVDAGASTAPFEANHAPLNIDGVKVWAPDGTAGAIENPARGRYRSTFDVKIDKPGTWRVGLENNTVSGTFKVDGEEWTVGRRRRGPGGPGSAPGGSPAGGPTAQPAAPNRNLDSVDQIPAGATDLELTEMSSRNEFFVTAGAPSDAVLKPTGKGLEFVPVTGPTDLVTDEPGKFRFLIDGKPAAGLKVDLVPGARRYRTGDQAQELTTDAKGEITVKWPVAGFYWLSATANDDKPSHPRATKRRLAYVATLEVVAP